MRSPRIHTLAALSAATGLLALLAVATPARAEALCDYLGEETHVAVESCWDQDSHDVFLHASNTVALTLFVHVDYCMALYEPEGMERKSGFVFSVPPMGSAFHTFSAARDDIQGVNMLCRFKISGVN